MPDHHNERISVFIPEFIKVEIGLNAETLKLANRALDILDDRKEAAALAEEVGRDAKQLGDAIPKT